MKRDGKGEGGRKESGVNLVMVSWGRRLVHGGCNGAQRCWWLGCYGAGRRSLQWCYCSLWWAITIAEGGAGVRGGE